MKIFNYLFYRFRWWLADHTPYLPKAPINVDLELAGKCNLSCTMCPYGIGAFDESKQGMMSLDMAEKVLNQAKLIGTKAIKLNFRGEPGLHKDLSKLIRKARSMGFVDVYINTNLLSFSENRLKELAISNPDKLVVSIDGTTKETYEKIRIGGKFERLISNISLFNKWKRDTKLILQMVSDTPDKALEKIPADEYRYVKVQDRGQGAEGNRGKRRRCPQPRQRLVVAWDGTIFACCSNWNNEYPLGNISDTTLLQAWNSERMKKIREVSTKCKEFPCKDCQVSRSYK